MDDDEALTGFDEVPEYEGEMPLDEDFDDEPRDDDEYDVDVEDHDDSPARTALAEEEDEEDLLEDVAAAAGDAIHPDSADGADNSGSNVPRELIELLGYAVARGIDLVQVCVCVPVVLRVRSRRGPLRAGGGACTTSSIRVVAGVCVCVLAVFVSYVEAQH